MKKYIVYICIMFFIVFSFSCMADENQPKNQQKISATIEKIQWQEVPIYGASYQEVLKDLNIVMTKYFFRILAGKDGGAWQQRSEKGNSIIEWIQLEPNTLTLVAKITKDPVHLFLAIETQTQKNNKWVSEPLTIRDKNLLYDIIEKIQFKILSSP